MIIDTSIINFGSINLFLVRKSIFKVVFTKNQNHGLKYVKNKTSFRKIKNGYKFEFQKSKPTRIIFFLFLSFLFFSFLDLFLSSLLRSTFSDQDLVADDTPCPAGAFVVPTQAQIDTDRHGRG